jgi:DNA-directed RNA polymerase alpha subunit
MSSFPERRKARPTIDFLHRLYVLENAAFSLWEKPGRLRVEALYEMGYELDERERADRDRRLDEAIRERVRVELINDRAVMLEPIRARMDEDPDPTPIEELEMSVRSYNCLRLHGFKTVGEVMTATDDELLSLRNFGRKALAEVRIKSARPNILELVT